MRRKSQPSLLVSLRRSQVASLAATVVDFGCLVFLVQIARVWYVAATAVGALLGAVTNFILGRHWSFMATHGNIGRQAIRYAAVSSLSLGLNVIGVFLLTEHLKVHYTISRAITAVIVAILFNFPLHRRFVFGKQTYA